MYIMWFQLGAEDVVEPVEEVRLRLRVSECEEPHYKTRLLVFPPRDSTGAQWAEPLRTGAWFQPQDHVPGHTAAVVVGILEEPFFKRSPVVSISGAIFYKHSSNATGSIQDLISSIEFKVEDLVKGSLLPFSSEDHSNIEHDLVSVVVTSVTHQLLLSTLHGLPARLSLEDHGLQPVPTQPSPTPPLCWVGRPLGALAGLVVTRKQLSRHQYQLEVYARDVKQASQLLHSLCGGGGGGGQWRVEPCPAAPVTLPDCVRSLAAELRLLRSRLLPNATFTPDQWAEFSAQLSELELNTDLNFCHFLLHSCKEM